MNDCIKDYTEKIDTLVKSWRDSTADSCKNDMSFKTAKAQMTEAKAGMMKKEKCIEFQAIDQQVALLMDKLKKTRAALSVAAAEKLKATTKRGDVGAEDDDVLSPPIFEKLEQSAFSIMKNDNMINVC